MNYGKCRGCGAPIVWIGTPESMPCDPFPVLYRARAGAPGKIVTPNGEVLSCDLNVSPEDATGAGYISHFSTCPQAGRFRKRRETTMTNDERAIRWFENELRLLHGAPKLNGCDMTQEWQEQIDVMETALNAIKRSAPHEKPLTMEQLREVPHGKIKDSTLQSICDRANEIACKPANIDRKAWKPCIKCNGKCYFCKFNETSKCGKCKNHEFYSPMFNFCPECGRPLIDDAWAELEKRLRGCLK